MSGSLQVTAATHLLAHDLSAATALWETGPSAAAAEDSRTPKNNKTHPTNARPDLSLTHYRYVPFTAARICVTRPAGASDTSGDRCCCLQPVTAFYPAVNRCASESAG